MSTPENRFNQAVTNTANVLLRHVVPLFKIQPGKRPALVGTSLLIEREATNFLVSARHVMDHASEPGGLHYYIESGTLHRLYGIVLRTQPIPDKLDVDQFDLSIVKLAKDARPPGVELMKAPLPFTALRAFQLPRTGKQYLVTGFPTSRSRANPHNKRLTSEPSGFRVSSSGPASYAALGLNEQRHIVLDLDIGNMSFPDGTHQRIADPHGMSGSPLWLLFDEDGSNDPYQTPVVGIVIEHHRHRKLLVATDIAVAIHLIEESSK